MMLKKTAQLRQRRSLAARAARPKGELERLAVRRLAAMRYRLAGATYSVIAEKLTEDRALEYADAHDISVERAMKQLPHVSKRTAWDDVTAEFEELRRETEMQRADLMALENANRRERDAHCRIKHPAYRSTQRCRRAYIPRCSLLPITTVDRIRAHRRD